MISSSFCSTQVALVSGISRAFASITSKRLNLFEVILRVWFGYEKMKNPHPTETLPRPDGLRGGFLVVKLANCPLICPKRLDKTIDFEHSQSG